MSQSTPKKEWNPSRDLQDPGSLSDADTIDENRSTGKTLDASQS